MSKQGVDHVRSCDLVVGMSRYKEERPAAPCHDDLIREVAQSVSIPVIAK